MMKRMAGSMLKTVLSTTAEQTLRETAAGLAARFGDASIPARLAKAAQGVAGDTADQVNAQHHEHSARMRAGGIQGRVGAAALDTFMEEMRRLREQPDSLSRFREAVRMHVSGRPQPPAAPPPPAVETPRESGRLSRAESMALLGLAEPVTGSDVKRAHREAMLRNHPDRGGNTYLMQLINIARDTLLNGAR